MISFKGAQYPKDVILFAVFFYIRYGVSYRDLEEIIAMPSGGSFHAINKAFLCIDWHGAGSVSLNVARK